MLIIAFQRKGVPSGSAVGNFAVFTPLFFMFFLGHYYSNCCYSDIDALHLLDNIRRVYDQEMVALIEVSIVFINCSSFYI